jgi:hypothetical protein
VDRRLVMGGGPAMTDHWETRCMRSFRPRPSSCRFGATSGPHPGIAAQERSPLLPDDPGRGASLLIADLERSQSAGGQCLLTSSAA